MWSPSTKRQEARAWGVPFLALDVNRSGVHYRVERAADGRLAVRPPLTAVKGVAVEFARELLIDRLRHGPYRDVADAHQRVKAKRETWEALVRAGAFDELEPRRDALFRLAAADRQPHDPTAVALFDAAVPTPPLAPLHLEERFVWDHHTTRMSTLELHALDLVRDQLAELDAITLWQVRHLGRKSRCRTAGLIVARQRPPTAKGFAFFVIEDGSTRGQVIISPDLWTAHRTLIRDASILVVDAIVEDTGYQLTLKAERLYALPASIAVRGYQYG
jgi:error-prone DNA polymerase